MSHHARTQPREPLITLPVRLFMFAWMWLNCKLGRSRAIITSISRNTHAPHEKRRHFQSYQPTERDVFVCTYAKSGTNWMLQIAHQIAHRGHGHFDHIHDVVAWPEGRMPGIAPLRDDSLARSAPTGLRVIKTHMESTYVPYSPQARYIVVVRDPKEVFVSSYFFGRGMLPGTTLSVEQFYDLFFTEAFPHASWAEHLAGYWAWRDRPNVLILTFDQLKADLAGSVQQVAALMGVDLTPDELALVVEQSTFEHMKQIDHKFALRTPPFPFNRLERAPMIRKGERGASSELLTPVQQAEIDRFAQAELRRRGCDFPYDRVFDTVDDVQFTLA